MSEYKTHSEKIREAVTELGLASPKEIMEWIKKHYPDDPVNPVSYRIDIIACSVNHTSSYHYPGMPKFLFYEKGVKKYRLYDPEKDRFWNFHCILNHNYLSTQRIGKQV